MQDPMFVIQNFLSCITYLCQEAERAGTKAVRDILATAQHQLVRNVFNELTGADGSILVSEEELDAIGEFLVRLGTVSPESLNEFIQLLESEDKHKHQ